METPKHYDKQVQPWDAMRAWMSPEEFKGFLRGNAIKYLARCRDKGGLDDLKKAAHYLEKLIEVESNTAPAKPVHEARTVYQSHLWVRTPESTYCPRCGWTRDSRNLCGPCPGPTLSPENQKG